MLQLRSDSPATTHAIAAAVASLVRTGDVIVLAGEMGAGKTAFAQGFGAALGVTDHMTSPTYNLVHSHPAGKLTLHHADLYRLSTQHEVADLAFAELAESDGVLLVEWGDVVGASIGDHLEVRLERIGVADGDDDDDGDDGGESADDAGDDERRRVVITAVGRDWARRWDRLTSAVEGWSC
jgi:tRNA threonylcarbamoyladenosine biosynthesis protein TsaE